MSRKVRRVPLGWTPPTRPHYDETFDHACQRWDEGSERWGYSDGPQDLWESWEDQEGPRPTDPQDYRPEWPEGTPLGYCLYEQVSEGSALSPVFATPEELVAWMSEGGSRHQSYTREEATGFVRVGFAVTGTWFDGVLVEGIKAITWEGLYEQDRGPHRLDRVENCP